MTGLGVHLVTKRHILNAHTHTYMHIYIYVYIYICIYIPYICMFVIIFHTCVCIYIVQDACLVGFNESKVEARTPVRFESKAEKSRLSWNAIYREFFSRRSAHVLATSCGRSNPKVYVKIDV